AVRRGADVIETGRFAEGDTGRIAAVLAADAELDVGPGRPAPLRSERDQLADPINIEADERIPGIDALVDVRGEETAGVVPRNAESCQGQVVGAEREELCFLCNFAGRERPTVQLEHRPDEVSE